MTQRIPYRHDMASSGRSYVPYIDRLLDRLADIEADYVAILEQSEIRYVNPNTPGGGVWFVGAADYGWSKSSPDLEQERMRLLGELRSWRPLFELLFPHPTPEVTKRHGDALGHLERWLVRTDHYDHSIPAAVPQAIRQLQRSFQTLQAARDLLAKDLFPVRVAVDTNVLLDDPDLTAFVKHLGPRYMVHVLPVVLRELDDHRRGGRNPDVREAAKRADRRRKALRDNGDVRSGAKVAGDVWAIFEHIEPKAEGLPLWLALDVPDDRFVASLLRLQK